MLNMIYFINKKWKDEYHGHLDLFSRKNKKTEVKIAPLFNRLALFNTGTTTFHGHPIPLECPVDRRRNSLACYYYVLDRPRDEHYTKRNTEVEWLVTRSDEQADLKDRGLIK
jgi:Rps23 Pro-64 3,4-dihydroxylase Tpa1-like proline 4-hydroxylase